MKSTGKTPIALTPDRELCYKSAMDLPRCPSCNRMAAINDAVCGKWGHSLDGMRLKIKVLSIVGIVVGVGIAVINLLDIVNWF